MENPLDNISALPNHLWDLIAFKLPFNKLNEFFDKFPQQRENIKFWKGMLNHTIEQYKKKYPKLYLFDCSVERQDFFFDKLIEQGYGLSRTYLACLFIFDIYLEENKEYWDKELLAYWHSRRHLPFKHIYAYMVIEEDLPLDVFLQSITYPCNDQLLIAAKLKYNKQLEEMDRENMLSLLSHKQSIRISSLREVLKEKEVQDLILPKLLSKTSIKTKEEIEMIKQYSITKGEYKGRIKSEYLSYLITTFPLPDNSSIILRILRALRGPKIKLDYPIENGDMPEIRFDFYHDSGDELIYYLSKEDNVDLIKTIENFTTTEHRNSEISTLACRLLKFLSPGSKCYSYLVNLLTEISNQNIPSEEKEDDNSSFSSLRTDHLYFLGNFQMFYDLQQNVINKSEKEKGFRFENEHYFNLAKIICGEFKYNENDDSSSSSSF